MSSSGGASLVTLLGVAGLEAYKRGLKDAGDEVDKFAGRTNNGLQNVGKNMQSMGKTLTRNVTLPIVGIGVASFKAFADFDQTIRQVGVQTKLSGRELQGMSKLAMKMGADTSFSAGEAATAMLELAKGGMSAADIKGKALKQTLTLAAAGSIELGAAAGYMANTLNMFGMKAGQSAVVAAALAGGANASTASVDSLGQALSQVGSGARDSGMGLNETVAALAAFDQAGIKGSDAGTSLKTMLMRLIPQSTEAASAMKKNHLEFTNANGTFKDMAQVAQELKTKLGPLNEVQRKQALTTIFGADAARAASVMMANGADGILTYKKATEDLGAAQKMAKTNTEGAKGGIEQMMGSLQTAGIKIGEAIAPSVIDLMHNVTNLANAFGDLDPHMQNFIIHAAGFAAVAGPALLVTGKMAESVGSLGKMMGMLGGTSGPAGAGMGKLGLAMKAIPFGPIGIGLGLTAVALGGLKIATEAHKFSVDRQRQSVMDTAAKLNEHRAVAETARVKNVELAAANDAVAKAAQGAGKNSDEYKAALERQKRAAEEAKTANENLAKQNAGGNKPIARANSAVEVGNVQAGLASVNSDISKKSGEYVQAVKDMAFYTTKLKAAQDNAKTSAAQWQKMFENGDISLSAFKDGMKGVNRSLADSQKEFDTAQGKIGRLNSEINKLKGQKLNLEHALGLKAAADAATTFGAQWKTQTDGSLRDVSSFFAYIESYTPTAKHLTITQEVKTVGNARPPGGGGGVDGDPATIQNSGGVVPSRNELNAGGIPSIATGVVPGTRGPNKDSVLAYLTTGEYVVDRPTVDKLGVGFFKGLQGLNSGGVVGTKTADDYKNAAIFEADNSTKGLLTKLQNNEKTLNNTKTKETKSHQKIKKLQDLEAAAFKKYKNAKKTHDGMKKGKAKDKYAETVSNLKNADDTAKSNISNEQSHLETIKSERASAASNIISLRKQLRDARIAAAMAALDKQRNELNVKLAKAKLTKDPADDADIEQQLRTLAGSRVTTLQSILAGGDGANGKLTDNGADGLDDSTTASLENDLTSSIADTAVPENANSGESELAKADYEGQLAKAKQREDAANNESAMNAAALRIFAGSNDLGYGGGANAFQAAQGARPQVVNNFNSLSGYDPAIRRQLSNTLNTGNASGENADTMYTGRKASGL